MRGISVQTPIPHMSLYVAEHCGRRYPARANRARTVQTVTVRGERHDLTTDEEAAIDIDKE